MYNVVASSRFKKDLKLAIKRGLDISLLDEIVTTLQKGEPLPAKNKDHALVGNYAGCRECHIQPDWLLLYLKEYDDKIKKNVLVLILVNTGTHSDIFKK